MEKSTKKSFRKDTDRPRVLVPTSDRKSLPSRVKQEPRDEVNINAIMRRMQKSGAHAYPEISQFRDVSIAPKSLTEAFNIVSEAAQSFRQLPLGFRRALDHNPANLETAPRELYEEYGLLKKKEGEPPTGSPVVEPKANVAVKKGSKEPAPTPDKGE